MSGLSVVTPSGPVLEREVDEVTVPGVEGEFGVLDGHIPFISATRTGVLSWRRGGDRGKVALGPGYVEVDGKGGVVALVQRAKKGEAVDEKEAERLRADAEARLKKLGAAMPAPGSRSSEGSGEDRGSAEQAAARQDLEWAQAQLEAR